MEQVCLQRATRLDGRELIEANIANRDFHAQWVAPFTDDAGFDLWLMKTLTGPNIGLVARKQDSGEIVGVINLNEIVAGGFASCYLGYYGYVRWARRGLMTEAVRMAIALGFSELGLHRMEANIQPGNIPSIRLAERLGFRKEGFSPRYLRIDGIWQDHERWALLNEEGACPR
jgi:[ribosomal protein S5]-alanine N-acetyltransferase